MAGAILTAVASIGLGVWVHPASWTLLAVAAILVWALIVSRKSVAETDDQSVYRRDFEQLEGIPAPASWAEEAVRSRLTELQTCYDEARLHQRKVSVWKQKAEEREEVEEQVRELRETRDEIAGRLRIAPSLEEAPLEEASLYYLTERLGRWQDAGAQVKELAATLEEAKDTSGDHLDAINEALDPYGFDPATDGSEAKAHIETLRTAHGDFKDAKRDLQQAEKTLGEARKRRKKYDDEIEELFKELDLEPGDDTGLARLVEQREEYRDAETKRREAKVAMENARNALEDHPDYEPELIEQLESELNDEISRLDDEASQIESLSNEIATKEDRIQQAMEQHDVEKAQAEYRRDVNALEQERVEDARRVAGHCLAEYVHEQTRDQELPRVFHEARALFRRITQGRYRLTFDHENASFAAYDTRKERGMALRELSSGTRVQLLLAVRVAFVTVQEQGQRLPLILDETLANSDDEKAQAIIEAVQEISADGRQVFYFTAQDDEVSKWKVLQSASEVDHRFIPLDGAADPQTIDETVLPPTVRSEDELPDPEGMTHQEYGAALSVPEWTPRAPLGELHLWYLIERVDSLRRVLQKGLECWGPCRELMDAGGPSLVGLEADEGQKVQAYATAVKAWKDAWFTGRGEKVDRAALEESGAVSETFMDQVTKLSDEVNGNAEALIEGLRQGKVKRFHENKAQELEDYFERSGYIDPTPTLSEGEIKSRVVSAISAALQDEVVQLPELWALLGRIGEGPAPNRR
ncbi:MAG: hypothetical protein GVY29_04250 [Spirochaetes bacterium]|nr:hypothetical protein [Spirochaetota bacterium]